jgi:antitoxin component HigA of HigAB toxin-antitoxin module
MKKRVHDYIPYIKDLYTIDDLGNIYSDISGKMKTRNKGNTEYQIINLMTLEGKKKTFRVHRLVMMAFHPIQNMNDMEVNHIDGNKQNNALNNLQWCTASENQLHAFQIGLQKPRKGEKSNFSKLAQKDVDKIFNLRRRGLTQKQIAEKIGCTRSNISYILSKKTW